MGSCSFGDPKGYGQSVRSKFSWVYNGIEVNSLYFSGEYRPEQPTYEESLAQIASEAGITEWDEVEQKEIAKSFRLLPGMEMLK